MAVDLSSSSSALSVIAGMPISMLIALCYIMLKPGRRGRRRIRAAVRVLLSRSKWLHPSTVLDIKYILVGALVFSFLFGYALIGGFGISNAVAFGLTQAFGSRDLPAQTPIWAMVLAGLALHLAFEFSYWLDHFLSHKIPFLWEFHKVHHSAQVLTPFANWRVHPVDTIVYMNILAVIVGSVTGVVQYLGGMELALASTAVSGVLYAIYMAFWGHLQHSQFWIVLRGLPGRIILSPAHHQIHHSNNPVHFDKNFGAGLAVWDWLFGTLHVPQRRREVHGFGTHGDAHLKKFIPSVLYPFRYAIARLIPTLPTGDTKKHEPAIAPAVPEHITNADVDSALAGC